MRISHKLTAVERRKESEESEGESEVDERVKWKPLLQIERQYHFWLELLSLLLFASF